MSFDALADTESSIPPLVQPLRHASSLRILHHDGEWSDKAAIVPFFMREGVPYFIVYAPVPQQEGEQDRILPFQLARGTIRAEYRHNNTTMWIDKGRKTPPDHMEWIRNETALEAALREAEEELGMIAESILAIYDCGHLPYKNPEGQTYSLHMFLARIPDASVLTHPDPYACAARHDGLSYMEAKQLASIPMEQASYQMRPFKGHYLPLLRALHDAIMDEHIR
ncbi:MAG: NUDIX domain-containing protein [Alphaproteobacteria bacterium]|nr:MAG: NUDIX domain-containing protein [Alphaproteobacteria bacterium]